MQTVATNRQKETGMNSSYSYAETWQSLALQELLKNLPQEAELDLLRQHAWVRHMERGDYECCKHEPAPPGYVKAYLFHAQVGREDLSPGRVATGPRLLRPGDPADEGGEQIGPDHRTLPLQGCGDASLGGAKEAVLLGGYELKTKWLSCTAIRAVEHVSQHLCLVRYAK